jgi:hypothetical protein
LNSKKHAPERPLRAGDVVEVKSAAEILATLDGDGALDSMPFMPEMARHAGRRYTVTRRVDKICDTVAATGSRRMYATVYLEDLRCDGSGHGRCQAGCRLYWKEAWLRRVDDSSGPAEAGDGGDELKRLALAGTRTTGPGESGAPELWRCQATEAFKASEPLKTSNLSQYWRELKNGNFRPLRFLGLLARAFVMEVAMRVGLLKPLPLEGTASRPSPSQPLNLRPGDRVRVKTPADIAATLDESGHNRGLSFDREMLPYCGRTFRIKDNVEQIVDDKTGRMLKIPKDSLILDGVVCSGVRSSNRWFCPREIQPFWREAWLERVEEADTNDGEKAGANDVGRGGPAPSASEQSIPGVGGS